MSEEVKQAIADIITVMSRAIGEEKNIPIAVKEMEDEYIEGNSYGFSFKAIVDLVVEERQARLDAEARLRALEDAVAINSTKCGEHLFVCEFNAGKGSVPYQAIQNSRTRNQT